MLSSKSGGFGSPAGSSRFDYCQRKEKGTAKNLSPKGTTSSPEYNTMSQIRSSFARSQRVFTPLKSAETICFEALTSIATIEDRPDAPKQNPLSCLRMCERKKGSHEYRRKKVFLEVHEQRSSESDNHKNHSIDGAGSSGIRSNKFSWADLP